MDQSNTVLIAVVVLLAVAVIGWVVSRRQRTDHLRRHFGPEYERLAEERGTSKAERELADRARRVEKLSIRPLNPERRRMFSKRWEDQQARFVEQPKEAIDEADHLVEEVMKERGYPVGDFDQKAADISVDHPHVVDKYREAHAIALRERRGEASTEDLRQAMIYFRDLFMDLLEDPMPRGVPNR